MIIADIGPYLGRSTPRPSMVVVNKKDGMYEYWQEMNDRITSYNVCYTKLLRGGCLLPCGPGLRLFLGANLQFAPIVHQ